MAKNTWNLPLAKRWKYYKEPIRPSKWDLKVFEKYLDLKIKKNRKDVKVLILGSTPELRSIVSKRGLVPYVCDYEKNNFEELESLKRYKGKEILVNQDWRKLKIKERFDLVFAEASLNMIKNSDIVKVLKNVQKALKDDGLFISKNWTLVAKNKLSLKKIIDTYRKKFVGKKFYFTMALWLYSYYYDKKKDIRNLRDQYNMLKDDYKKGEISKKEFDSTKNLGYENYKLEIYIPKKSVISNRYRQFFKIKKIIYPEYKGVNKIPIYILSK